MAYYFEKGRDKGYTFSAFVSCSAIRSRLLLLREAMKYNGCGKILEQQLMSNVAI